MESTIKSGGKRPGAGRPKGEPGRHLKYWVKQSMADEVDIAIRELLIDRFGIAFRKKSTLITPEENLQKSETPVIHLPPTTLGQLKALCPTDLKGMDRSLWIRQKRVELGI